MKMVARDFVAKNFDPHDPRQTPHPLPNEFPSMFVVRPGERILPAEISSSHTSIDAMHHMNFTLRQHIPERCVVAFKAGQVLHCLQDIVGKVECSLFAIPLRFPPPFAIPLYKRQHLCRT
jgi:hypothetical protein